ncbi:lipase [Streptomyces sp. Ru73]|uniref:alpha/beta hydrolase fold domain-containing protein n=1 Tax=Streptomyces sp. Ru73 TaxID=2080748 RepID=UPI000CDD1817|nr:alpha/beta hydrolase fold domain-containing protein [Streptomyces sp. Ru73]POX42277.1 lipase [Streptomyces sp. Ru73]
MPSLSSRALLLVASALGHKMGYRDLDEVRRKVEKQQRRPAAFGPPRRLDRHCRVTAHFRHGWPCYEVAPRDAAARVQVLYLHGGAYIEEIGDNHWNLIEQLATTGAARVVVPVHPLAPRGTASAVVPDLTALAGRLTGDGELPTVFMGDSAGGGLSVTLAQRLRDTGGTPPAELVLISPWLDAVLDNPGIEPLQPHDPMLGVEALRYCGSLWAGELDLAHPWVSPVRGSLAGLPRTTVFAGTRDILTADARGFRDRASAEGVDVDFTEEPGQIHVYPLWPTPEAHRARRHLLATLPARAEAPLAGR